MDFKTACLTASTDFLSNRVDYAAIPILNLVFWILAAKAE